MGAIDSLLVPIPTSTTSIPIASDICDLLDHKLRNQTTQLRALRDELVTHEREMGKVKGQLRGIKREGDEKTRKEVAKVVGEKREVEFELFKERVTNRELREEIAKLKNLFRTTRSEDVDEMRRDFERLRVDMMDVVKAQCGGKE
ncbi:hypothetical protein BC829DRAFT_487468 [Chytridium lagenaria]|nr:hypothetical protein BC829DRAFT_487468 [Chytridium lagenaria]